MRYLRFVGEDRKEDSDNSPMMSSRYTSTAGCHKAHTSACRSCPRQFDCVMIGTYEPMRRSRPRQSEIVGL